VTAVTTVEEAEGTPQPAKALRKGEDLWTSQKLISVQ